MQSKMHNFRKSYHFWFSYHFPLENINRICKWGGWVGGGGGRGAADSTFASLDRFKVRCNIIVLRG